MKKTFISIALLLYAVFGGGMLDLLDRPLPEPPPEAKILNIDKPSSDVIDRVQIFSDLITEPSDRAKIAIFNYDFAQRVLGYETTSQQVNDVYSLAGKTFFKKDLVDKYEGLAEEIVGLLQEVLSKDNSVVSEQQKQKINEYFMGVSWVLIQKG